MSNDRLRAALSRAALSTEQVARRTDVDPKTVQKWLSGRVPHPRHRWAVAELVNEDEEFLWPEARRRSPDGLGGAAEIVTAFARRADVDNARWRKLISQAEHQIDMLGYTLFFLPQQIPDLVDVLLDKCERGCRIRMMLADPECEQVRLREEEEQEPITLSARIETSLRAYEPLMDCRHADIRFQHAPLYNSVYRFDDEMFVTPHLYAKPGHSAPLLHLRRLGPNGIFAQFTSHFEGIWADSEAIEHDRTRKPARAGR